MHENSNPYASPHESSELGTYKWRSSISPPGWVFWCLWVAASAVCSIVRLLLQMLAVDALAGNTGPNIVLAFLVLDPAIAALSGYLHWLILRPLLPRPWWWVLATAVAPLAATLAAAAVYDLAMLTGATLLGLVPHVS